MIISWYMIIGMSILNHLQRRIAVGAFHSANCGTIRSAVRHFATVEKVLVDDLTADYGYHYPVMRDECCNMLNIQPGKVYVDCTLGGGGHTKAILERGGFVIGIDQDPDAIARSGEVLKKYIDSKSCELIRTNFRNIKGAIANSRLAGTTTDKRGLVDGVLMDLGVSSYQINEATRGFAFGQDGPLDMRMSKGEEFAFAGDTQSRSLSSGLTAYDIINTWDASDLADVFYNYGDEVRSRVLAREIVSARPLNTTGELEKIISKKTAFEQRAKTLARCFQALRIVVNDEMGALEDALADMQHCIRHGGRFVVMSYHSLEDRKVKNLFRTGNIDGRERTADGPLAPRGGGCFVTSNSAGNSLHGSDDGLVEGEARVTSGRSQTGQRNPWELVTKRAITPSEAEIEVNRRARSAKLRVATQVLLHKEAAMGSTDGSAEARQDKEGGKSKQRAGPRMGAKQLAKLAKMKHAEQGVES